MKALYRLGQAHLGAKEWHNALEALVQAAKLAPQDKAVRGTMQPAAQVAVVVVGG